MSRRRVAMRDAALGYASRGIPALPLHFPLPHHSDLSPPTADTWRLPFYRLAVPAGTRAAARLASIPLGSLVPHGVKDATCKRARILAWWTRHP
jgi:hypothetical protein